MAEVTMTLQKTVEKLFAEQAEKAIEEGQT